MSSTKNTVPALFTATATGPSRFVLTAGKFSPLYPAFPVPATVFVYTQDVPCLVPNFDWVLVVRKRKAHFWSGTHSEVGVLSAARFRELALGHLTDFDSDEVSLQVLSPKATSDLNKRIQTCEFEYPKKEFEVLAPDGFVDIE